MSETFYRNSSLTPADVFLKCLIAIGGEKAKHSAKFHCSTCSEIHLVDRQMAAILTLSMDVCSSSSV